MYQGHREDQLRINRDFPYFDPKSIHCVVLSHAHIDHSGRIPLLVKQGFRGQIFTTRMTARLLGIMLRDSAHIQEFEAEWRNRKAKLGSGEGYTPLYDMADTERILKNMIPGRVQPT